MLFYSKETLNCEWCWCSRRRPQEVTTATSTAVWVAAEPRPQSSLRGGWRQRVAPCHQARLLGHGHEDQISAGNISLLLVHQGVWNHGFFSWKKMTLKGWAWRSHLCKSRPTLASRPGSRYLLPLRTDYVSIWVRNPRRQPLPSPGPLPWPSSPLLLCSKTTQRTRSASPTLSFARAGVFHPNPKGTGRLRALVSKKLVAGVNLLCLVWGAALPPWATLPCLPLMPSQRATANSPWPLERHHVH